MKDKYLNYLIKSNKTSLFIFILVGCVLLPMLFSTVSGINAYQFYIMYILIISILCPSIYLTYIHKKREINFNLNLPLNKKNIWLTRFIFTLTIIWVQIIVCMLVMYFMFLNKDSLDLTISFLLTTILILLLGSFIIVSICSWIISKCNNVLDSIFCIIAYLGLPVFTLLAINQYLYSNTLFLNKIFYFITKGSVSPLGLIYEMVINKLVSNELFSYQIFFFAVFLVIGCVCFVYTRKDIGNHKVEDAGENTNKRYLYPLIAVWVAGSFMILQVNQELITFVFILILFLGILSLEKRKLVITKEVLITFGILAITIIGFNFVFHKTQAFGLEEVYAFNKPEYISYTLYEYEEENDENFRPVIRKYTEQFSDKQMELLKNYIQEYIVRYHTNRLETLIEFDERRGFLAVETVYSTESGNRGYGETIQLDEYRLEEVKRMLESSGYNLNHYVLE